MGQPAIWQRQGNQRAEHRLEKFIEPSAFFFTLQNWFQIYPEGQGLFSLLLKSATGAGSGAFCKKLHS
jgi:hypothetical protein